MVICCKKLVILLGDEKRCVRLLYYEWIVDEKYKYINPVQFGYENCSKMHSFGPAVRTYWLIHYVVSGKGFFEIQGKRHALNKGEMFVIPPYVETYYEAHDEDPWEYIWVGFVCDGELPITLTDTIWCPAAGAVFEDMKKCHDKEGGKTAFLCAKIWELFSLLMDKKREETDYVEKALNYIHTEYINGITVQDVADLLNLNRTYFSVLFKKSKGVSPAEYILQYRMERAVDLLINNHKSISVTAHSVGYVDVYTFSKVFKKRFGVSPRAYVCQMSASAQE